MKILILIICLFSLVQAQTQPIGYGKIIKHKGFTLSYVESIRLPLWVSWKITNYDPTKFTAERKNKFIKDPLFEGQQANIIDYRYKSNKAATRGDYDRGHMCPAEDMAYDQTTIDESFYFTNICPQLPNMNQHSWEEFEEQCRKWSKGKTVYVYAGPVIQKGYNYKRIGINNVVVPEFYYKIIITSDYKNAVAIIMKNSSEQQDWRNCIYSIDMIEKWTGIDFFSELPDSEENQLENIINKQLKGFQ
jgi:endonuclease G